MTTMTVGDLLNDTEYVEYPILFNWDEEAHPRDAHGRFGSGESHSEHQEGEGEHGNKQDRFSGKAGHGSLDSSKSALAGSSAADRAKLAGLGSTESHSSGMKDISSALAATKQVAGAAGALKTALGQKVWDKLPPSAQAVYTGLKAGIDKVEHALEVPYKAGNNAAKEVMRAQGMNENHVEAAGKMLGTADGVLRWSSNIPVAHEAIHLLTGIGGPVAFLGAKVGYYTPVASLAYVGASLAKAAVGDVGRAAGRIFGGKNPFQTISIARAAIRGAMQKQSHEGGHGAESHLAHGVAGAMHFAPAAVRGLAGLAGQALETHAAPDQPNTARMRQNAPKLAKAWKTTDFDDEYVPFVYAALDECQGDMDKAIKFANIAYKKAAA